MDGELETLHRLEDPGARELDRLAFRHGEHETARAGRANVDERRHLRSRVARRRVGLRRASLHVIRDQHRRLAGRASLVDRLLGKVLVGEGDDQARVLALNRTERGRRVAAGDELAADRRDGERDEIGRADDVDVHRRLGRRGFGLAGRREQTPAGGEAERVRLDDGTTLRPCARSGYDCSLSRLDTLLMHRPPAKSDDAPRRASSRKSLVRVNLFSTW